MHTPQTSELEAELDRNRACEAIEHITIRAPRCALKDIVRELHQDPAAMPGYFQYLEKQFESFQVEEDIKAMVLQAHLNPRAHLTLSRLGLGELSNYQELKKVLLREFKVSPILLRERFVSRRRQPGETYSQVESDLHTPLSYYGESRNINKEFHRLMS